MGGNVLLTVGAIAGGACFGDNIGLISDAMVVSSGIQNVAIIDRVRHQGIWSLGCLLISLVIFYLVGMWSDLPETTGLASDAIARIPESVWTLLQTERPAAVTLLNQVKTGVPLYMLLPLVAVLGLAIRGTSTLICLGSGIISSLICGLCAGTVENLSLIHI